jgi:hypothetical protein
MHAQQDAHPYYTEVLHKMADVSVTRYQHQPFNLSSVWISKLPVFNDDAVAVNPDV